jgi:hypothetical protein
MLQAQRIPEKNVLSKIPDVSEIASAKGKKTGCAPDDAGMRNVPAPYRIRPDQIKFRESSRFAEQRTDQDDSAVRVEFLFALPDFVHHSPVGLAVPDWLFLI